MTTRHRTNHPLLSLCVLAALALFLSGCSVWHYVATDTAGRAQAVTYTAQTATYHLRVVATHHDGTCAKRVLYYDARSGLHTRPNVSEAHAVDRDCDMLIDRVRLTRASDARMYRLFQWQIRRDLQAAYHKALTR